MSATLRCEAPADEAAIRAVVHAAFKDHPHSDGSEPGIVDGLRRDGDLVLSVVAEMDATIVGHIAISPVTISSGASGWFGLGPVSVAPDKQNLGIGSMLVRHAVTEMRERHACGIVLLGDPGCYARFGFVADPRLAYPGPPPVFFQSLLLDGDMPQGEVSYAPAFV